MDEQIVPYGGLDQKQHMNATGDIPTPVIKRTFLLLDLLADAKDGLSLSELARISQISKSSIYNLLKSLELCGIIEQPNGRLYVLGAQAYRLAAKIQDTRLWSVTQSAMLRLAAVIGQTVTLARIEDNGIRILDYIEANGDLSALRLLPNRGSYLPFPAGAHSRAVFGCWTVKQRQAWLRTHQLPRYTDRSIVDPEQFLQAVEEAANTGFAVDYEEFMRGINAVAVPITREGGVPVAVIFAFGLASAFCGDVLLEAGTILSGEADAISRLLSSDS